MDIFNFFSDNNKAEYDKLNDMSLKQLKHEYKKCKSDDTRKNIIKKIVKKKLVEKELMEKEINEKVNNLIRIKDIHEKENKIKKLKDFEKIMKQRGYMEKVWESNRKTKQIDTKFKIELENDFTNNKLMERLNSELGFRINEKKSKEIIKPFYQYSNSKEDSDSESKDEPITNFSSKRLIR